MIAIDTNALIVIILGLIDTRLIGQPTQTDIDL